MTALLEIKQKLKGLLGSYEFIFLPILRFVVAFLLLRWINTNLGFMERLNTDFMALILAVICGVLPAGVTIAVALAVILMHCYALSLETVAFMAVLVVLLAIFFLRFSYGTLYVMAVTPIALAYGFPVMLPIGSGLLSESASAVSASCGTVLFYFIRFLHAHSEVLGSAETEPLEKVRIMTDGLLQDWGMWITMAAFILVILLVHFIRTRSLDYAWRIAILLGGFAYVAVMLAGSYYLEATVDVPYLMVSSVIAVLVGLLLEFFFFGGDYSRTERLEYEDDEYYYYVKAVPKATVATAERQVKKIGGQSPRDRGRGDFSYLEGYYGEDDERRDREMERKLEESLRDLL